MRINHFDSALWVQSAVFKGAGTQRWGNAARLAALWAQSECAQVAERAAIDFSARASADHFIISLSGGEPAEGRALLQMAQSLRAPAASEGVFERLKAQLAGEKSDFDLLAQRGFMRRLLGCAECAQMPSAQEVAEFLAQLKTCQMEFVLTPKSGEVGAGDSDGGDGGIGAGKSAGAASVLQINFSPLAPAAKETADADTAALLALERPGDFAPAIKPAAAPFFEHQKAACTQSFVYFGAQIGAQNLAQRAASAIISAAFGSGFCSRLIECIRVREGLAYSAHARVAHWGANAYWLGFLQTAAANEARACELVREQFAALKSGLSADEFAAAKDYLIASEILRRKDYASAHRAALSALLAGLGEDFYERLLAAIKSCSIEAANAYAAELCARELSFFIVGPDESASEGADGE